MSFHVQYTKAALKQLKKMNRFDAQLIVSWIGKNLEGCDNPRVHGKGLTANRSGEWRYRVGSYRIVIVAIPSLLSLGIEYNVFYHAFPRAFNSFG